MSWIISYKNLNLIEHHSFNLFSVIAPYGSLEIVLIVWLNYPITFSRGKVYQNFQSFPRQKAWESEVRISAQCFMCWLISIDSTVRPRSTCHKGLWPVEIIFIEVRRFHYGWPHLLLEIPEINWEIELKYMYPFLSLSLSFLAGVCCLWLLLS